MSVERATVSAFEASKPPATAAGARRLSRPLAWCAGAVLGIVLPVLMVVANKSAPVPLAVGAVLANLAVFTAGNGRALLARYRKLLSTGAGPLIIAWFAWAAVSLLWTISVAMTLRGLRETLPELVLGCAVAAAWPLCARRSDLGLFGIGVIGAGALIASEAATRMPLHHLIGTRALWLDLKRSSIPPLLLMWPAIQLFHEQGRRPRAVALGCFAMVGAIVSHSSASVMAILVGGAVYLLAQRHPRGSVTAYGAIMLALLVVAPWTGTVMSRAVTPTLERTLEEQHAKQRVAIWSAFEARVWQRPWLGHGFDASFRLGDAADGPDGLPGDHVIRDIHPHNQLLQVWIDFGAVGAVGVLLIIARIVRTLPGTVVAPRLGFLASASVMGLVGVQAWDAWWLATLAVGWGAFTVLAHEEPEQPSVTPVHGATAAMAARSGAGPIPS